MAQYRITHTCGHEHTYNLFGPHKERDRKQDWLAGCKCPACKRADEAAARDSQNRAAASANQSLGAVALTGTESQIGYAESIRARILALAAQATLSDDPRAAALKPWLLWLQERPDAAWWIESYRAIGNTAMGGLVAALDAVHGRRTEPGDLDMVRAYLLAWPALTDSLADELQIGAAFRAARAAQTEAATAEARRAEIMAKRPPLPAWLKALRDQHGPRYWNGKIYSGRRIYIANEEMRLTEEQEREILDRNNRLAAWTAEAKAAGIDL